MPTFRQLEVFVEAARDLNFRQTADRLSISQPAVSRQIQALERELACRLFDRSRGRTVRLSSEGHRLLERAQETLAASRKFVAQPDERMKTVKVGLRHYLLETHIRQCIAHFLEANPRLDVQFRVIDDVGDLAALIQSGQLDLGLFRGDVPATDAVSADCLHSAPISFYATPLLRDDLSKNGQELSDAPFIMLSRSAREPLPLIADRLWEVGITPRNIVARTQFADVMKGWCLEGRGVAILFDEEVHKDLLGERIVKIGPDLRPLDTILLARHPRSQVLIRVIEFLASSMSY